MVVFVFIALLAAIAVAAMIAARLATARSELADARARLEMSEAERERILGERNEQTQSLGQIDQLREDLTRIKNEALPELLKHSAQAASGSDRVESRLLGWTQSIANPQSRGAFGELAVENQLQNLGLELGRDYMKQVTSDDGSKRPDYIVRTGQGSVIIDAKFVLDEGLDGLTEAVGGGDAERLVPFGRKLKSRVEDLSKRDYAQLGGRGPTAVLLYVPVEGAHEALKALPGFSLEKFSRQHRVYVVTPSQLPIAIGLVAEVAHVARRDALVEETAKQMLGMAEDMCAFVEGLDQHGKHLQTAFGSYDKLVGMASTRGRLGRRIKPVLDFARRSPQIDGEIRQLAPPRDDAGEVAERWAEAG
jgi:DNA anti-recombination protein RmuC